MSPKTATASPVDAYLAAADAKDRPMLAKLRAIARKADPRLEESIKWGAPSYALNGPVCSFHAFKSYTAMWFAKGELLSDPEKILIKSEARHMRQIRFESPADIDAKTLTAYIREAAALNEKGAKVKRVPVAFEMPEALAKALARNKKAKATFEGLAPSCKREYAEYVGEAKKVETIERRVEKTIEMLADGKSLNDKYK